MSDNMGVSMGFTHESGDSLGKKKSALSNLKKTVKSIDDFSEGYHMKIKEDEE